MSMIKITENAVDAGFLKSAVDSATAGDIFPAMTIGLWIARRRTR
jgi:hypothetical protein